MALVGYIISKNGALTTRELRDFLKTRLPVHMIPSRFVTLKAFPATANGKTDRSRLPSLETDEPVADSFVPPRTEDEEKLAAIWREVLEIRQVGVHDNFFEIGGDSLSATRAFARVKRTFAANLSLRHIFEYPTISSLAEVFQTTLKRGPVITNKIIPRRHRDARAS